MPHALSCLLLMLTPGLTMPLLAGGSKLGGKDLVSDVEKLGGTTKRLEQIKDREAYIVNLQGTKTTDDDLAVLAKLKGINGIDLSFTAVTDKGVAHFAGYELLFSINLTGTKVTDAVIADLKKMPWLHSIDLALTSVTDKGIAQLVEGKSLTVCRVGLGEKAHYRVYEEYDKGRVRYRYLMIGDTYFGKYFVSTRPAPADPKLVDNPRLATTYYHRNGPVGQVMSRLEWFQPASLVDYPSDVRLPASLVGLLAPTAPLPAAALVDLWSEPALGVVRLNVGTHAAYGRPYQTIHFYNSTPEIKSFSLPAEGKPVYFGFVQDALQRGCNIRVIDGAERPALGKKGPKHFYSALFIEITRNELRDINTELLTKEALAEFMETLTEKGVLCFHTSHRYHIIMLPIIDAAKSLTLAWKVGNDTGDRGANYDLSHFGSEYLVIARKAEYLQHLTNSAVGDAKLEWSIPESSGQYLWRDGQPHDLKPLARK